ncbi:MAG: MOSC domain-containing protein [Clostridiales bacterium]|jgi:molybdenum cofactor synthesis domain-containing protein|nr:MOSC domain-containing protein [Clostridiales bacterium]
MGVIKAVCISETRGVQKRNVGSGFLKAGWGIEGDAHGGDWHRQVSLLSYDKVADFNEKGAGVGAGDFAENILVEGIDFAALPIGTLLSCGHGVLEITQIGKECHNHCQIYHKMGDCIMPREGVFARVAEEGAICVGDDVEVLGERKFSAAILTLSDKGHEGTRADISGEVVKELLEAHGYDVKSQALLPDEFDEIVAALKGLCDNLRVDLIVTTGGTGFSKRDVTPEATLAAAQRVAPGIAEAIRVHSMSITPRGMFGRGAAAIRGGTLIINLPGSPKAVKESLEYILPHLGHGLEMLRK